jgi:TonB-dependent starch-binding outer membrane protein SusC
MTLKRLLNAIALAFSLAISLQTFAQETAISGKVVDAQDNAGVAGVTVTVKGSKTSTLTASDGSFKIKAAAGATLVFTSVNMSPVEMAAAEGMAVKMTTKNATLNDVVVIGYGTARKKDLTGSVVQVSSKDFVKGAITTPEQLIAGKVAGVQITSNSGQPGAGSRIRIRAGSSLNASNDPLIVIDGVPVDNNGISGAPNALALINPNDIEDYTVLKDASAAAIYGSRASNGVLLITTKRGNAGGMKVSFSSQNSIAVKTGLVDVMSGDQMRAVVNQFGTASDKARLGTANTNWQEEIYRPAFTTDNNISVVGGIKKLPYRLSLGYLSQDGILKRSNLQRVSIGLNLSPKFFDNKLSVNTNIKYSLNKNFYPDGGAIGAAVYFDPTQKPLSGNQNFGGFTEWLSGATPNTIAPRNPLGLLEQQENKSDVNRLLGNIQLDYKFHFLPALRANLNVGLDRSVSKGTIFIPGTAASSFSRGGVNNAYEQTKTNKLLEFYLAYEHELKSIESRFDIQAGYTYQDWLTQSPAQPDRRADGSIFKPAGQNFETQNTLISFYGRAKFNVKDRYLLTASLRRDGSSRYSAESRWGNFPSVAAAWNLTNESFMAGQNVFSNLKLRASWGITGQQDGIGDYAYQPVFFYADSAARYLLGNQYITPIRPQAYDANLKWEETEAKNIGLDMGLFNGRVNLSVEYFEKNTKDLLSVVPAPAGTNFSNEILTNIGSIKNRGLEVTLNGKAISEKDYSLDLGFNITYIMQNEITRLQLVSDPNFKGIDVGGTGFNTVQKHTVGYRPNTFFLYQQVYDKTGSPLEGVYVDRNRDGAFGVDDQSWSKNPEANVFLGFTASGSYKKFDAGFTLRASTGNYVYNAVRANAGILDNILPGQTYLNNGHVNYLTTGFKSRQTFTDYYLENASFLRMDNIYVNYSFGKVFNNKANLRVSFNVQNVFVITKYSGLDPEVNGGIDNTIFPRPRTFSLGFNLDF